MDLCSFGYSCTYISEGDGQLKISDEVLATPDSLYADWMYPYQSDDWVWGKTFPHGMVGVL